MVKDHIPKKTDYTNTPETVWAGGWIDKTNKSGDLVDNFQVPQEIIDHIAKSDQFEKDAEAASDTATKIALFGDAIQELNDALTQTTNTNLINTIEYLLSDIASKIKPALFNQWIEEVLHEISTIDSDDTDSSISEIENSIKTLSDFLHTISQEQDNNIKLDKQYTDQITNLSEYLFYIKRALLDIKNSLNWDLDDATNDIKLATEELNNILNASELWLSNENRQLLLKQEDILISLEQIINLKSKSNGNTPLQQNITPSSNNNKYLLPNNIKDIANINNKGEIRITSTITEGDSQNLKKYIDTLWLDTTRWVNGQIDINNQWATMTYLVSMENLIENRVKNNLSKQESAKIIEQDIYKKIISESQLWHIEQRKYSAWPSLESVMTNYVFKLIEKNNFSDTELKNNLWLLYDEYIEFKLAGKYLLVDNVTWILTLNANNSISKDESSWIYTYFKKYYDSTNAATTDSEDKIESYLSNYNKLLTHFLDNASTNQDFEDISTIVKKDILDRHKVFYSKFPTIDNRDKLLKRQLFPFFEKVHQNDETKKDDWIKDNFDNKWFPIYQDYMSYFIETDKVKSNWNFIHGFSSFKKLSISKQNENSNFTERDYNYAYNRINKHTATKDIIDRDTLLLYVENMSQLSSLIVKEKSLNNAKVYIDEIHDTINKKIYIIGLSDPIWEKSLLYEKYIYPMFDSISEIEVKNLFPAIFVDYKKYLWSNQWSNNANNSTSNSLQSLLWLSEKPEIEQFNAVLLLFINSINNASIQSEKDNALITLESNISKLNKTGLWKTWHKPNELLASLQTFTHALSLVDDDQSRNTLWTSVFKTFFRHADYSVFSKPSRFARLWTAAIKKNKKDKNELFWNLLDLLKNLNWNLDMQSHKNIITELRISMCQLDEQKVTPHYLNRLTQLWATIKHEYSNDTNYMKEEFRWIVSKIHRNPSIKQDIIFKSHLLPFYKEHLSDLSWADQEYILWKDLLITIKINESKNPQRIYKTITPWVIPAWSATAGPNIETLHFDNWIIGNERTDTHELWTVIQENPSSYIVEVIDPNGDKRNIKVDKVSWKVIAPLSTIDINDNVLNWTSLISSSTVPNWPKALLDEKWNALTDYKYQSFEVIENTFNKEQSIIIWKLPNWKQEALIPYTQNRLKRNTIWRLPWGSNKFVKVQKRHVDTTYNNWIYTMKYTNMLWWEQIKMYDKNLNRIYEDASDPTKQLTIAQKLRNWLKWAGKPSVRAPFDNKIFDRDGERAKARKVKQPTP